MKIQLERTGGFAGIKLTKSLDSADLSPSEVKDLENLLEKSHFFDLSPALADSAQGADRFYYKLTIEAERGTQTMEVGEASLPLSMRPLLHWLERHAG